MSRRDWVPPEFHYVPPEFPLVEYQNKQGRDVGRRDFFRWSGVIGELAQAVTLEWSNGAAEMIVATRSSRYGFLDEWHLRFDAAFLLLAGEQEWLEEPFAGPLETRRELERLSDNRQDWSTVQVRVEGQVFPCQAFVYSDMINIGFLQPTEAVLIAFASRNVPLDEVAFQWLTQDAGATYSHNPLHAHKRGWDRD